MKHELTKKQMDYLYNYALFTGSRCFGGYEKTSDYDFVIHIDEFEKHFHFPLTYPYLQEEHYREDPANFDSFRCSYQRDEINLIVVSDYLCLDAWFFTSEIFKESLLNPIINSSKQVRHRFFQNLKVFYMQQIQEIYSDDEYQKIRKEVF